MSYRASDSFTRTSSSCLIQSLLILLALDISSGSSKPFGLVYEVTDMLADILEIQGGNSNATFRMSTISFHKEYRMKYVVRYCDEEIVELSRRGLQFCGRTSALRTGRLSTWYVWMPSTVYSIATFPMRLIGFRELEDKVFNFDGNVEIHCDKNCYARKGHRGRKNISLQIEKEFNDTAVVLIRLPPLNETCPDFPKYPVVIRADYVSKLSERGYIIFRNARLDSFRLNVQAKNGTKSILRVQGSVKCARGPGLQFFGTNGPLEGASDANGYIDDILTIVRTRFNPMHVPGTFKVSSYSVSEVVMWLKDIRRVKQANFTIIRKSPASSTTMIVVNATFTVSKVYVELSWSGWINGYSSPTADSINYFVSIADNETHTYVAHIESRGISGEKVGIVHPFISQLAGEGYLSNKEAFREDVKPLLKGIGLYFINASIAHVDIRRFFDV